MNNTQDSTQHVFTDLEAAHRFYMEQGSKGVPATLQTDIPTKQWTVTVYRSVKTYRKAYNAGF